jgi:hypothetical protein
VEKPRHSGTEHGPTGSAPFDSGRLAEYCPLETAPVLTPDFAIARPAPVWSNKVFGDYESPRIAENPFEPFIYRIRTHGRAKYIVSTGVSH